MNKAMSALIIGIVFVLFACGGGNNSNSERVDSIPGVSIYPPYDVMIENSSITLSGKSTDQTITRIIINGDVVTAPDLNDWQHSVDLEVGDNDINVEISTSTQTMQVTRTVRYHGIIPQGSENAMTNPGGDRMLIEDYRGNRIVEWNFTTGFARAINDKNIAGLPNETYGGAIHGDTAYVTSNDDLYKVDLVANTASLLATVTGGEINNPIVNAAGTTLYFSSGAGVISAVDTTTGAITVIASAGAFADDAVVHYVKEVVVDDAHDKLIGWAVDYTGGYPWHEFIVSIDLTGSNAGRYEEITLSSDPGCTPTLGDVNLYFAPRVYGSTLYMANARDDGQVLSLDTTTYCLQVVLTVDPQAHTKDSSLQGVDFNPATQDLYLGFFSGVAKYNLTTMQYGTVEPEGFASAPKLIEEPEFMALDVETGRIYNSQDELLSVYNPVSHEAELLHTFTDDVGGMTIDAATGRLYVITEDGEIGAISLADQSYTQLQAPNDQSPAYLSVSSSGLLYYIDDDDVYSFNPVTLETTNLSPELTDSIDIYRHDGMAIDEANNRLIFDSELAANGDTFFLIAVDLTTGARSILNPANTGEIRILEGIALSADGSSVLFEDDHILYNYNLQTLTLTELLPVYHGFSKLGDVTQIQVIDSSIVLLADDDINGFWLINLDTGERVIIQ